MQSIIELDLPESLANEIDKSVRPEYLKLSRSVPPGREEFFRDSALFLSEVRR